MPDTIFHRSQITADNAVGFEPLFAQFGPAGNGVFGFSHAETVPAALEDVQFGRDFGGVERLEVCHGAGHVAVVVLGLQDEGRWSFGVDLYVVGKSAVFSIQVRRVYKQ